MMRMRNSSSRVGSFVYVNSVVVVVVGVEVEVKVVCG